MKKKIFNLLIMDASGSMSSKVEEVQGGINQIIQKLIDESEDDKEVSNRLTLVDFSSHNDYRILIDNVKAKNLEHLADEVYSARSMTALYDAIGKSFALVPEKNDGVMVTIFTDGLENDSKEFIASDIKRLIEGKEKEGWLITYMGTNQEAMLEAERMGIKRNKRYEYANSKAGTFKAMRVMDFARLKHSDSVKQSKVQENPFEGYEDNVDTTLKTSN